MKINQVIAAAVVAMIVGLQAWTLQKVVSLSEDVAVLKASIKLAKL